MKSVHAIPLVLIAMLATAGWAAEDSFTLDVPSLTGITIDGATQDWKGQGTHVSDVAHTQTARKCGSSGFSGKGLTDSEEKVSVIAEAVGHSFDDFDGVVKALDHAVV